MTEIKALVHDVFGTVVDWRGAVTADGEALGGRLGITGVDWQEFADQWRGLYAPSMNKVRTKELPWTNLDALHRMALDSLLDKFGIAGKLSEEDKVWFNLTWHRLKPWPDSVPGLTRIKKKFIIATLSNGTVRLLTDMAKHCGLPWDTVLGSDIPRAYKPDAGMYQSAIELLGSGDPGAVMMTAAHNNDLVAASKHGMKTAYINRPYEKGTKQDRDFKAEHDFTYVATSFEDLATQLGT
ncbi:MAG TPA: haloacid dehalogenase type II [Stellaceae bacterium]|jgi:2-haloacid dehalogenase|nr:haloacid dehalogenase type II [Stellaceae bacterium]